MNKDTTHFLRTRRLHVWYDRRGRAGMWPTLCMARSGRNGSPAGFGPKRWPRWFIAITRPSPWSRGGGRDNGGIIHWNLPRR